MDACSIEPASTQLFMGLLSRLFGRGDSTGYDVAELARRLGMPEADLRAVRAAYHEFTIPKHSGGSRTIAAPEALLKLVQRRILRRLLAKLRAHPAVTGFESGHSVVTNALPHVGQQVVVRLDIKNFFTSTTAKRVEAYFRRIGWNREAADLLTTLTTRSGSLPQGAPTSPRLANLLNFQLDQRLSRLAESMGATYTRYADDLTFSLTPSGGDAKWRNPKTLEPVTGGDDQRLINVLIHAAKTIVRAAGYDLHQDKKLTIRRRHDRQMVTGIVVNERAQLPRDTRRWLRAVEHHLATGRPITLKPEQLQGWRSLKKMVETQAKAGG